MSRRQDSEAKSETGERLVLVTESTAKLAKAPNRPGVILLILGTVYPLAVIVFELMARWCSEAFFDPMPTAAHAGLLLAVPLGNLAVWYHARTGRLLSDASARLVNGFAIGIAAYYALIFLPLAPLALVAVVFYGLGLLPLSPAVSLGAALALASRRAAQRTDTPVEGSSSSHGRFALLAGLGAAAAALVVLDIPQALTRLGLDWATSGSAEDRAKGIKLIRAFGDEDLLLRLCYERPAPASGPLSLALRASHARAPLPFAAPLPELAPFPGTTADAREVFYAVTGTAFNARPAPAKRTAWLETPWAPRDRDRGGTDVGGRAEGLSLASSRLDGSISGDDAVAYLEWTLEFRNTSAIQQEARLDLALPPDGVVSRATLWINGEEREAAYRGKGQVRQAYERVVRARRDPLLVTTKGADRILAQAFPIEPNGGTLMFKVGITAPLDVEGSSGRLVLPAIVNSNFDIDPPTKHGVWIESKTPLSVSAPDLKIIAVAPDLYRLVGEVSDTGLAANRQIVTAERDAARTKIWGQIGAGKSVVQELVSAEAAADPSLVIAVDGSARVKPYADRLISALDRIPDGMRVGLVVAGEQGFSVPIAPWSKAQKGEVASALKTTRFVGGEDNAPALIQALMTVEPAAHAELLWIHGPQPVAFAATSAQLWQTGRRLSRLPNVTLYDLEPGPNAVLPDEPWAWSAHTLPQTGGIEADLGRYFDRLSGASRPLVMTRTADVATNGIPRGSEHVVRLWARDQVLSLGSRQRDEAATLAASYNLVTPVSGAVVLESQQQYAAAGFTPAGQGVTGQASVPTVPEPHEWALLIVVLLMLTRVLWRRALRTYPARRS